MNPRGRQRVCGTALLSAALLGFPSPSQSLDLAFPAAAELAHTTEAAIGQHPIATAAWSASGVPTRTVAGLVQEFTWQITGENVTTLGLLNGLRAQLDAQGYTVPFTCFASACGGFDFRYGIPVGTAPEMYVDLGDFHYLTALSEDEEIEAAIMISRGGAIGFVHMALIQPPTTAEAPVILSTRNPNSDGGQRADAVSGALITQLVAMGFAPLDDLQFETGASQLSGTRYPSLDALAAFLDADPSATIVLVGHTDALGSLSGNIALSRARALAVRQFLTEELGVDPAQVEAQGIGYLAPRAANTTEEGREANRRVEVVLATP